MNMFHGTQEGDTPSGTLHNQPLRSLRDSSSASMTSSGMVFDLQSVGSGFAPAICVKITGSVYMPVAYRTSNFNVYGGHRRNSLGKPIKGVRARAGIRALNRGRQQPEPERLGDSTFPSPPPSKTLSRLTHPPASVSSARDVSTSPTAQL